MSGMKTNVWMNAGAHESYIIRSFCKFYNFWCPLVLMQCVSEEVTTTFDYAIQDLLCNSLCWVMECQKSTISAKHCCFSFSEKWLSAQTEKFEQVRLNNSLGEQQSEKTHSLTQLVHNKLGLAPVCCYQGASLISCKNFLLFQHASCSQ